MFMNAMASARNETSATSDWKPNTSPVTPPSLFLKKRVNA